MSEDNKDFGDKAEDAFDNAEEKGNEFAEDAQEAAEDVGDSASEAFEDAKEATEEFAEDTKEATSDFSDEAKKTANEFSEGLKNAGGENKKILVGILAIIFGSLGVHKFLLGYNKEGFILLGVTIAAYVLSCFAVGLLFIWIPTVIGLIEGIIYLTKSDEEFYNTYQVGKKPWF